MVDPKEDGYYYHQTRFISRLGLTSGGKTLKSVACVPVEPHARSAAKDNVLRG